MILENLIEKTSEESLSGFVRNYVDYNLWTNLALVNWLSSKPVPLLEKEVISSFPSISLTLQHMWQMQGYWFALITKKHKERAVNAPSVNKVMSGILAQSAQIADAVSVMSAAELYEEVTIDQPWFTCAFAVSEYLIQLVNHNTFHRGQIITMGRQLGFTDLPITDYHCYNIMGK